jgi:thiol-disulfide isomerase/thioredoxin
MNFRKRHLVLGVTVLLISAIILVIENLAPSNLTKLSNITPEIIPSDPGLLPESAESMDLAKKAAKYPRAIELNNPSGFLNNGSLKIADLVGKKVILVDFWTYSCINCQRTLPYITSWYEKYRGKGLEIVGVHTPEFEFEKIRENVQKAIDRFGIKYPVVQDNDYGTWGAYKNRYWPRKYLIDIDGFIVYDHIGEGAYEETEREIQKLLKERLVRLGETDEIPESITTPANVVRESVGRVSPEVYFGSRRNQYLTNGTAGTTGIQSFEAPSGTADEALNLAGRWNITDEYAEALTAEAQIFYGFTARDVYMVLSADAPVTVRVTVDGKIPEKSLGADVSPDGTLTVGDERLYHLLQFSDRTSGAFTLTVEDPGLKAFTFTFG